MSRWEPASVLTVPEALALLKKNDSRQLTIPPTRSRASLTSSIAGFARSRSRKFSIKKVGTYSYLITRTL